MTTIRAQAPAKINLTLHVTGQRPDGYHMLDSLVVFASVADHLTATPAPEMSIKVTGPFAAGVPADETNLILRAASILRKARGVTQGATLTLEKNLPHAAGIGSGSSDAAATLVMLAKLWGVAPLDPTGPEVLALGADVPVSLAAPAPMHMSGIGEVLSPVPALPRAALVLVRPSVDVPTPTVFKALKRKDGAPMEPLPEGLNFEAFAAWLSRQRNDLLAPAAKANPEIAEALSKLDAQPAVIASGMSGSGATCYGLVKDMAIARQVARLIQVWQMGWWVVPAEVLQPND